jgi:hypothetical protein
MAEAPQSFSNMLTPPQLLRGEPGPAAEIPEGPVQGKSNLLPEFSSLGAVRPFGPGEYITLPSGGMANEMTITTQLGDKWAVLPGLWIVNGVPTHVSEDQAAEYARQSGLNWPTFDTVEQADKWATDREDIWERTPHGQTQAQTPLWSRR